MKKLFVLLSVVLFVASCGNAPEKSKVNSEATTQISVNDFYANPEQYLDSDVTVKGLVTHVCKHGGQKLFIVGSEDGEPLRIDVGESIPEFAIEMEGTEAEFTGKIVLMDEETIAAFEAEHEQNHAGEAANEDKVHTLKEKNYHLIAKSFRSL